jgi:hypothetical protein
VKKGIAILLLAVLFSGCKLFRSIEKREEYKDNIALQRVQAKKDLADQVYIEQAKLHPCENVITKFIPGKADSIPYPVLTPDTSRYQKIVDSLQCLYADDLNEAMRQAAKAGYDECAATYKKQMIPLPVHDTVSYEDGRKLDVWKMDAESWKEKYLAQKAVNDQSTATNKGKILLPWWLTVCFSIVFIIIGYILAKFK